MLALNSMPWLRASFSPCSIAPLTTAQASAGPYSSPEGLNRGSTHGCLMTFADAAARNSYLTHPDHEKVKEQFLPFVEEVVAFDFEESV